MPWTKSDLPPSVKGLGFSEDQKSEFVRTANAVLEESGDEGKAIAVGINAARGLNENNSSLSAPDSDNIQEPIVLKVAKSVTGIKEKDTSMSKDEKRNAKKMPEIYYARHMNNGVAGYQDEVIYVSTETMKRMCKSFDAKPVFVGHAAVDLKNIQEQADGYVSKCFYNELDGWLWAEIIVVSDEGHEAVEKGWSVSNAYLPTEWGAAGTCHDVAYDREILEGTFTHLAIVDNPRYEKALIMNPDEFKAYQEDKKGELVELKNAKEKRKKLMFWKKQEVTSADEIQNAMVDLKNGSSVSVKEMVEAIENQADEKSKEEKKADMGMKVNVGDKEMTLKELINRYEKMNEDKDHDEKSNEDDEDEKENEGDKSHDGKKSNKKDEKSNEDDEDEKKNDDAVIKAKEKKNSKHFDELMNASAFAVDRKAMPESRADRLKRGQSKY